MLVRIRRYQRVGLEVLRHYQGKTRQEAFMGIRNWKEKSTWAWWSGFELSIGSAADVRRDDEDLGRNRGASIARPRDECSLRKETIQALASSKYLQARQRGGIRAVRNEKIVYGAVT